jgi:hypothetical protein
MAVVFPGMNPYLEGPTFWPGFHHFLADEIVAFLNARLGPRYYADLEVRTVLEEVSIAAAHAVIYPDAAVLETGIAPAPAGHEGATAIAPAPVTRVAVAPEGARLRTVLIAAVETGALVTAIELLSPANKRGTGLHSYREKRLRLLQSDVHLIELDLLRGGERPGWEVNDPPLDTDYVLLVNRANEYASRTSEIWPLALNAPFPTLPVPLCFPDDDIALDLGAVFRAVYERAAYARRMTTDAPLPPPEPRPIMAAWLAGHTGS